jgi:hypothetical protein
MQPRVRVSRPAPKLQSTTMLRRETSVEFLDDRSHPLELGLHIARRSRDHAHETNVFGNPHARAPSTGM